MRREFWMDIPMGVCVKPVPCGISATTAVAAFTGRVKRRELATGDKEDSMPVFITGQAQTAKFSDERDGSAGRIRNADSLVDSLGRTVQRVFADGGKWCHLAPLDDGNGTASRAAPTCLNDSATGFRFAMRSAGPSGP